MKKAKDFVDEMIEYIRSHPDKHIDVDDRIKCGVHVYFLAKGIAALITCSSDNEIDIHVDMKLDILGAVLDSCVKFSFPIIDDMIMYTEDTKDDMGGFELKYIDHGQHLLRAILSSIAVNMRYLTEHHIRKMLDEERYNYMM